MSARIPLIIMAALLLPAAASISAQEAAISVRGEWTIEVRNHDGSVASRHQFTNGLSASNRGGGALLARLLTRDLEIGTWMVFLLGPVGGPQPCTYDAIPSGCGIRQVGGTNGTPATPAVFETLSVSRGGPSGGTIILSGTATALSNGNISSVATNIGSCATGSVTAGQPCTSLLSAPLQGGAFFPGELTAKHLPQPISVTTGQILHVTVQISFS
jgi:hypothetical protein